MKNKSENIILALKKKPQPDWHKMMRENPFLLKILLIIGNALKINRTYFKKSINGLFTGFSAYFNPTKFSSNFCFFFFKKKSIECSFCSRLFLLNGHSIKTVSFYIGPRFLSHSKNSTFTTLHCFCTKVGWCARYRMTLCISHK